MLAGRLVFVNIIVVHPTTACSIKRVLRTVQTTIRHAKLIFREDKLSSSMIKAPEYLCSKIISLFLDGKILAYLIMWLQIVWRQREKSWCENAYRGHQCIPLTKSQSPGALIFSLLLAWTSCWTDNGVAAVICDTTTVMCGESVLSGVFSNFVFTHLSDSYLLLHLRSNCYWPFVIND